MIKGLNKEEVEKSREEFGSNTLTEKKGETILQKAIGNFKDPIIALLTVMCVLSFILAFFGVVNITTPIGILVAVVLATFVSTLSEAKNEKIFETLKGSEEIKIRVYRDSQIVDVNINDIVVGDKVILQSGDGVPADGVIISGKVSVDQSAINGESEDVLKIAVNDAEMEEVKKQTATTHPNLVFRGTVVTNNEAVMEVTAVGDNTVYGSIAQAVQDDNEVETPLKVKLKKLAQQISLMGYTGGALIAIVIIARGILFNGVMTSGTGAIVQMLLTAITMALSIIVMAVPEGLPLLIALVCTLNMRKMFNENVLVRDTNAVETAGSLNILFSDKTGTITQNKFQVVNVLNGKGEELKEGSEELLDNMLFNNSAKWTSNGAVGSNSTDRALLNYVKEKTDDTSSRQVVAEIKFNSTIKYSAVSIEYKEPEDDTDENDTDNNSDIAENVELKVQNSEKEKSTETITYIKGAPEVLMKMANIDKNSDIQKKISEMTTKAMRVLGFAHVKGLIDNNKLPSDEVVFDGVVGIRDEIRLDAKEAIEKLQSAGVQVVMITGDCKETAVAISKDIGLLKDGGVALTSEELEKKSDDEVKKILPKLAVVSRALPLDKQRLVRLSQELNLVTGMTGDGVNDSPALKQADVGFAMGSGTQVAKLACGITILDDSLKSIVSAVSYGRTIYHNIQKFLIYQLTINVSAMLICLLGPLMGVKEPLTVPQILIVNIIMDTLAAIALGGEPVLPEYMQEKPKKREQNILTKYIVSAIAVAGVWMTIAGVTMLKTNIFDGLVEPLHIGTVYFTMFVMFSVFNGFNVRTNDGEIFRHLTKNKPFIGVMSAIVLVQVLLVYCTGNLFDCVSISIVEWALCITIGLTLIPVDMIRKFVLKLTGNNKNEIKEEK